jgi:RHH-type rel operon transcriptional repressor/antitoxin RelB
MATSIRLEPEIEKRLDHLAAATGRTKAFYLRELITNGLADLEDLYLAESELEDLYLAESELLAIRAGKSRTTPLETVMKRYGMEA